METLEKGDGVEKTKTRGRQSTRGAKGGKTPVPLPAVRTDTDRIILTEDVTKKSMLLEEVL